MGEDELTGALRNLQERHAAGGAALMSRLLPRAPSARDYRIRVHTDPVQGPGWLRLLATCAYLRGVIVVTAPTSEQSALLP